MSFLKTKTSVTRRNFFAVPGAVALGVLGARKASACSITATCISHTDTTVTIRVVFGTSCGVTIPDQIKVSGMPGNIGPLTFGGNPLGTTDITITDLTCDVAYTFKVQGVLGTAVSDETEVTCTPVCVPRGCTRTQGYWKNHPTAWPVASLILGNAGAVYSKAQLLAILGTPVRGNGLISLSWQLIAAKLNVAAGASSPAALAAITAADNLIGTRIVGVGHLAPSATSAVAGTLDSFNNGNLGPFHCS